ncbi:MAG: hypothetical protein IJM69_09270, partial [Firmicutes bacterium]|nr:hypothetical protein [Bacillota bacterium]
NYDVTQTPGTLTITKSDKPLVITSSTKSWTYDGETHTDEVYTVTYDGAEVAADETGKVFTLPTNDTLTITATAEGVKDYSDSYSKNNTYTYDLQNAGAYTSVTANFGTLSIDKREVTIQSADLEREYTGNALTNAEATELGVEVNANGLAVETGWVDGEGETYEFTGSQTVQGESPNAFSYTLTEATKADNYRISKSEGTLKIIASTKPLVIASSTKSWTYDGTTHKDEVYTVTYGGETVTADATGKVFTLPTNDTLTITATAEGVKDYSESYNENNTYTYELANPASYGNVTANVGTLSIEKRTVALVSESGDKPYDGTPLTKPTVTGWQQDDEAKTGFVTGEVTDVKATGSVTTVAEGEVTNTIVYTEGNAFKAENYTITKDEGTLKITASTKPLVITSSTKSWVYDATTHKDEVYTVTYDGEAVTADATGKVFTLPTGDKLTITATAEGVRDYSENYNENNTYNYDLANATSYGNVTANVGTLSIEKRALTITAKPQTYVYNGILQGEGDTAYDDAAEIAEKVDVEGLQGQDALTSILMDGSEKNAKVYEDRIEASNAAITNAEGKPATDNYDIAYVKGTLTITKKALTLVSAIISKVYDGTPLTNDDAADLGVTVNENGLATEEGWVEGEGATYDFTGSITLPGQIANAFEIIAKVGTDLNNYDIHKTENDLTVTNRNDEDDDPDNDTYKVTFTAKSDSATYDATPHTVTGFVEENEDGSLTWTNDKDVTFTISGISASETQTEAGTYVVKVEGTPVVTDPEGNNVTKQFTVTTVDGELKIEKRALAILADSDSKVYDGAPLTISTYTSKGLAEGDTIDSVTVTGSQTDVGESENVPSAAKILNAAGKDVTASYEITYSNGILEVTPAKLPEDPDDPDDPQANRFDVSQPDDVVYNGQDQKQPVTIYDKEAGKDLVEGTDYTLAYSDDVKNVGEVTITVTGKDNYSGTFTRTYKITPKPLTITADSDSKVYDGEALTKDSYTDTGLATGDSFASVTVTGSQTEVGKSENVPSDAKIVDADGQDMNANYEITYEKGELEVTPAKLPEDPDDPDDPLAQRFDVSQPEDVKYNGKEQKQPLTITDNETGKDLVEGTDYELTYSDDVTNAGEVTITVKGIGNYSGTFTRTYQITKREITLTSGSDRKLYDGTPLTKDGIEVSGDGFAEGEGADYDVFGSQTYVGESANDFSYTLWGSTEPVSTKASNVGSGFAEAVEEKGVKPALIAVSAALADVGESEHKETKASNYEISMVPGTLTVTDEENGDRPDGVVTKTHEDKEYKLGETVVFTIQVTNIYD